MKKRGEASSASSIRRHITLLFAVLIMVASVAAPAARMVGAMEVFRNTPMGELATDRGHESGVSSVAISPDGRSALSGCFDGTLTLWPTVFAESRSSLVGRLGQNVKLDLSYDLDANGNFAWQQAEGVDE